MANLTQVPGSANYAISNFDFFFNFDFSLNIWGSMKIKLMLMTWIFIAVTLDGLKFDMLMYPDHL